MILARASKYCIAASFALIAVQAQADVLEIDANGARWVAGNFAVLAVAADLEAEPASSLVPGEALASAARNSAAIPDIYKGAVHTLAERFDLSPSLLEAVVWQESRWRENAVSHAGARGLAQLMPGTAAELGVDPDDPLQNLEGGARYLREQLDRFDGDLEKALAAYNAGPGRVIRAGGIPNIYETKQYVAAIMGRLANHSRPADQ
ncbi:lytic transglycosylase domain-containing protein [Erythrobacter sp. MTPC3]|uniref:lytic transglycosylase domain-containing protein n=1 Tax=Erythrobacter sp. MTPC3 TaxID=3056564 RepID=UPI0036F2C3BA